MQTEACYTTTGCKLAFGSCCCEGGLPLVGYCSHCYQVHHTPKPVTLFIGCGLPHARRPQLVLSPGKGSLEKHGPLNKVIAKARMT